MRYEGPIYRPPSEANSLILQVAVGCSYNGCTFCHSFQDKSFRIKSFEEIKEDIDEAASFGRIPRVFLADGDALIIPQEDLKRILSYLNEKISGLERVGLVIDGRGYQLGVGRWPGVPPEFLETRHRAPGQGLGVDLHDQPLSAPVIAGSAVH